MQLLNNYLAAKIGNSSMIRRMFEAGIELKKQFGADNVYDFSLGNPDLPPPPEVKVALEKIAAHAQEPFAIGYMPNAGYPTLREKLASQLSLTHPYPLSASDLIMTCGAAGGLNVFFRTVLNPGDEVLVPSPFFVEYGFYAANYQGTLKPVPTKLPDFSLDINAFEHAITPKTKAIILNSPNNPTGAIYSSDELSDLAALVSAKIIEYNHPIHIISDEPYRFLNFDNVEIPSVFKYFNYSVVIGSYSKNLSLAGERIGYIAVNPTLKNKAELLNGLTMSNRILGFVNAPALAQQIIAECMNSQVDLNIYRERRSAMANVLDAAGIEYTMPRGAFYFFPKSPVPDEQIFINALLKERILAVPGSGFGLPGYFRLAFCVNKSVIESSAVSFKNAVNNVL